MRRGEDSARRFGGLDKASRSASAPAIARFRLYRLCVFSSPFGVGFGRLAVAAVSRFRLVVRVRHTSTTLLN